MYRDKERNYDHKKHHHHNTSYIHRVPRSTSHGCYGQMTGYQKKKSEGTKPSYLREMLFLSRLLASKKLSVLLLSVTKELLLWAVVSQSPSRPPFESLQEERRSKFVPQGMLWMELLFP